MRLGGFFATALGLLLAACASPYPQYVAVQPHQTRTACARVVGETKACRPSRLAAVSASVHNTRAIGTASSGLGGQPIIPMTEVPPINVEQVCQGIASQGDITFQGHGMEWEKKDCVDSEQKVRDQLAKIWGSFDTADRNHCVNETRMGGESSYTELLTCLEMAADVRKMHEEAKTARHPETVGQR
jgi:hypothetical protein